MSDSHPPLVRRVIVSAILIAGVLGGGAFGLRKLAEMKEAPGRAEGGAPLPVVRVESVHQGDHREVIRGYGIARAFREARVAAEVPGVIRHVAETLRVGATVGADEAVLVRIDDRDLADAIERLGAERRQTLADQVRVQQDLESFDAQLAVADKRLETARSEEARVASLVPATLTQSELDRQRLAVFALEQMRAELQSRQTQSSAQLGVIEAGLDQIAVRARQALRDKSRTEIRAPFEGRVRARHVEVGLRVAPGAALFDLVDPTVAEVGIQIPAGRYDEVRAGSRLVLRLRPEAEPFWSGPVARVDPMIDAETRTFRVWAEVRGGLVAPGAPVIADAEGALAKDVLAIPREAFLDDAVYLATPSEEDGVFVARRITPPVLRLLPGLALVKAGEDTGIHDGDRVVITNLEDLAEGSRIRTVGDTNTDTDTDGR